jgi:methylaspartate mutase sigma subunit
MTIAAATRRVRVLLTSTHSDAHTWNLIYLQLFCEELGHEVINLGACVPAELLLSSWRRHDPDVVVVSSVNGHGYFDGLGIAAAVRRQPDLCGTPMAIGGRLSTAPAQESTGGIGSARRQRLRDAGFDLVLDDGDTAKLAAFLGSAACLPSVTAAGRAHATAGLGGTALSEEGR